MKKHNHVVLSIASVVAGVLIGAGVSLAYNHRPVNFYSAKLASDYLAFNTHAGDKVTYVYHGSDYNFLYPAYWRVTPALDLSAPSAIHDTIRLAPEFGLTTIADFSVDQSEGKCVALAWRVTGATSLTEARQLVYGPGIVAKSLPPRPNAGRLPVTLASVNGVEQWQYLFSNGSTRLFISTCDVGTIGEAEIEKFVNSIRADTQR
jgi:hypothetical protein